MDQGDRPPWPRPRYPRTAAPASFRRLLASPEVTSLVADLEATRWRGRPGYPIRAMVGNGTGQEPVCPGDVTVRLVAEHAACGRPSAVLPPWTLATAHPDAARAPSGARLLHCCRHHLSARRNRRASASTSSSTVPTFPPTAMVSGSCPKAGRSGSRCLRPRRFLGTPERDQHPQGRRLFTAAPERRRRVHLLSLTDNPGCGCAISPLPSTCSSARPLASRSATASLLRGDDEGRGASARHTRCPRHHRAQRLCRTVSRTNLLVRSCGCRL